MLASRTGSSSPLLRDLKLIWTNTSAVTSLLFFRVLSGPLRLQLNQCSHLHWSSPRKSVYSLIARQAHTMSMDSTNGTSTTENAGRSGIVIPEGYTLHTENSSHILISSKDEAFLNPVQEFNRDLSVACIRVWSEDVNREKEMKWKQAQEKRAKRDSVGKGAKKVKGELRSCGRPTR